MWETLGWVIAFGLLGIGGYFLFNLAYIVLVWIDTQLNSEPAKPEPLKRSVVNGSVYLRRGDQILDVGRGVRLSLSSGLEDEPNADMLTWEGKRRIVGSSPPINMTMQLIRKALGDGDNSGPALPMQQGANPNQWLPVFGEDEDE